MQPKPFSPWKRALLPAILTAGTALLISCSGAVQTYRQAFAPYQMIETPAMVEENMREIDAYRGDGTRRSIRDTISTDASFHGLGDRLTTAGVQFSGPICRIQIKDVLLTTLKNNRSLRVEDYNRTVAEKGIDAAKGIYDLMLQSSYNYAWNRTQTPFWNSANTDKDADDTLSSKFRQHAASVSLGQLLPSGGILSLFGSYGNTHTWAQPTPATIPIDPYESFSTGLSFTQPLLKGFGPYVTNAPIVTARLKEKQERENFRDLVISQLTSAIKTYWDLVFTIENHEVQKKSLDRAKELLRISIVKRDTGVEPPTVVLEAEAEVSRREALLIDAQSKIASTADSLKRAMNLTEGSAEWNYNVIPVDRPSFAPLSINEEAIYAEALSMRPDYRAQLIGKDIAVIGKNVAENQKLPQLNAIAGLQATGLGRNGVDAGDNLDSGKYWGWNAGLVFSYPLQNRQASANYEQKKALLDQSAEQLKNLEEIIRLDLRSAIRGIETNLKLITAYESNVKSEEAKLDSQIKRFNVGLGTLFEVLSFQEDLANAQVNYLQSIISYNKAIIDLQRSKGSFLGDYRVEYLDKPVREAAAREAAKNNSVTPPAAGK